MANVISTLLKLDSKDFKSGMKSAQQSIAETQGTLNKGKAAASSFWSSLSGAQKLTGIGTAAIAVGAVAKKAIDDASNLTESINAVEVAYGSAADSVLKLGDNSAESFGLSKRALNEFAVQFSAFDAKIAAGTGEGQAKVLEDITQRVADFASVMNIDLADAAQVFQSSLSGETEPIRKFGVDMSAAAVEAFALSHGLIATKSELTENIKVQARYGLLMEQTSKVQGDFKNTSDGLANSQRILSANIENLSASLGEQLIPQVADAVGRLNDLAKAGIAADDALNKLTRTDVAGWAKRAFGELPNPINQARSAVQFFRQEIEGTFTPIDQAATASQNLVDRSIELAQAQHDQAAGQAIVAAQAQEYARQLNAAGLAAKDAAADTVDFGNAVDVLPGLMKKAGDQVDFVTGKIDELRGLLDLTGQLDDINQGFADVAEAAKDATNPEGARKYRDEVRRLQGQLLDLVQSPQFKDLSGDKRVKIIAEIAQGNLESLRAALDDLTKDRFINLSIIAPKLAGFDSANASFNPSAGTIAPIINNPTGPSTPVPVQLDQRQITYNFPVGTTPTTQYIDATINARRNGSR